MDRCVLAQGIQRKKNFDQFMIHFMQMSVVDMSTKFGYMRLIPSGDIPHFIADVVKLAMPTTLSANCSKTVKNIKKSKMLLFFDLVQTCHMQILVMIEPKLEEDKRNNSKRQKI
ncbi:hypothetical protein LDENG_00283420 [Lucifuga dentata]|nr:hypothetical protein LDENG_00283420 [Lucifuga dentata]